MRGRWGRWEFGLYAIYVLFSVGKGERGVALA